MIQTQTKTVRGMSDEKLAKELTFAEGFAPPTTDSEATWLELLRMETQKRGEK